MTFNPEAFADMKDKYFLLNGRSYPDTVTPGPMADAVVGRQQCTSRSRCLRSSTFRQAARRCCASPIWTCRNMQTLASLGIPMHVVGYNAKLLRDQAGNNMDYYTNSITLGGGESLDVILDASNTGLYSSGQRVLSVHPSARPPVQRRRELRRPDDRSPYLQFRRPISKACTL